MDDFSSFASAPSSKKTDIDDPTADFLAREAAVLGNDAQFLAGLSSSTSNDVTTPISNDFETSFPSIDQIGSTSVPTSAKANEDDEFGAFHSEYPAIETTDLSAPVAVQPTGSFGFGAGIPVQPTGASGSFGLSPSPSPAPAPRFQSPKEPEAEPTIVREHREKQLAQIKEKDERSEAKKQENVQSAHEAIDRFYEEYNDKKARAIAQNRDKEQEFLTKRDQISTGTQWERINHHIDSSPATLTAAQKASKRDTSRMRALLRDLQKDSSAPGN
ncbi:hypothetical protein DFQ27_001182 [Actinomortierella ambigua]|uniref:Clathrin light chain n=1 Tax=Actinomortierella ambigua TaxID=1343610 RepID=A0A9P6QAW0_9FUNG|nr:hypothetical protein DFQ27_001182 [Actinomortierella ambigua]